MEILIIIAVIAFIANAIKKAGEAQTSQQKREYERQFQQYQRRQVSQGYNQTGQQTPSGTMSRRTYHTTVQGKEDKSDAQSRYNAVKDNTDLSLNSEYSSEILQSELTMDVQKSEQKLKLDFSKDSLLNSIILSEILAPPKARR